jgi:hypothetical protein
MCPPCQLKTLHLRHSPLLHLRNWMELPVSEEIEDGSSCQPVDPMGNLFYPTVFGQRVSVVS